MMIRKTIVFLIKVVLVLVFVLAMVSLFGPKFGVNIQRYKQYEYDIFFILGVIIIILGLLYKIQKRKEEIKKGLKFLCK